MRSTRWLRRVTLIAVFSGIISGCSQKVAKEPSVTVFAAASMTDVITEVAKLYEAEHGVKVKLNFASSGQLARQIYSGAQADLFLSASKRWADYLTEKGICSKNNISYPLSNGLVVVAPIDSSLEGGLDFMNTDLRKLFRGRLSIGDERHVPVGMYSVEALKESRKFEGLKNRFILGQNTRSTLMKVELGECELGIVYRTDALKSQKVKVVSYIPNSLHKPIGYSFILCNDAQVRGRTFYDFLKSSNVVDIYTRSGFTMIGDPTSQRGGSYCDVDQIN